MISGGTKTICMEASVGDITESCEYTTPFITNSAIQYVGSIEELLREDRTSKVDALKEDTLYDKAAGQLRFIIWKTAYEQFFWCGNKLEFHGRKFFGNIFYIDRSFVYKRRNIDCKYRFV